jgi:hypothetical protein
MTVLYIYTPQVLYRKMPLGGMGMLGFDRYIMFTAAPQVQGLT